MTRSDYRANTRLQDEAHSQIVAARRGGPNADGHKLTALALLAQARRYRTGCSMGVDDPGQGPVASTWKRWKRFRVEVTV